MVCLIPTNETLYNEFMDSIETIPFTDEEVSELNEILADDDDIPVQPINLEHVFNDETSDSNSEEEDSDSDSEQDDDEVHDHHEEHTLEEDYFPTLTTRQLQDLATSAYHDTNPHALSALLDPIALDFDVTSDSIKHELICFHRFCSGD